MSLWEEKKEEQEAGIHGPQSASSGLGNVYAENSAGLMDAVAMNTAAGTTSINAHDIVAAQGRINAAVAEAMKASTGLSPEEKQAAVDRAVGSLGLTGIDQNTVNQLKEQAVTRNTDTPMGGTTQAAEADKAKGQGAEWAQGIMEAFGPIMMMAGVAGAGASLTTQERQQAVASAEIIGQTTNGNMEHLGHGTSALQTALDQSVARNANLPQMAKGQGQGAALA